MENEPAAIYSNCSALFLSPRVSSALFGFPRLSVLFRSPRRRCTFFRSPRRSSAFLFAAVALQGLVWFDGWRSIKRRFLWNEKSEKSIGSRSISQNRYLLLQKNHLVKHESAGKQMIRKMQTYTRSVSDQGSSFPKFFVDSAQLMLKKQLPSIFKTVFCLGNERTSSGTSSNQAC